MRVRHRDSFLKLHLLIQGGLFAAALNLVFIGNGARPELLLLAAPLSLVFALLFFSEDRLIGQLSAYVGDLASDDSGLEPWDRSQQLRKYAKLTVGYRAAAHLIAFFIIPSGLLWKYYSETIPRSAEVSSCISMYLEILGLLGILVLVVCETIYRSKTGQPWQATE